MLESYEQLELSYNNKILVANYKSMSWLEEKVSILIAIINIFITIGLTFFKDLNIKNINENIKI